MWQVLQVSEGLAMFLRISWECQETVQCMCAMRALTQNNHMGERLPTWSYISYILTQNNHIEERLPAWSPGGDLRSARKIDGHWTARSRAPTSKVLPKKCNSEQPSTKSGCGNLQAFSRNRFLVVDCGLLRFIAITKWKSENVRWPPKRKAHTKKVQLVQMKIKGQQNYLSSKDGQTW